MSEIQGTFIETTISTSTSVCPSICVCVCVSVSVSEKRLNFLQSYHKMSLIKVAWKVLGVKNMHSWSPSGKEEVEEEEEEIKS